MQQYTEIYERLKRVDSALRFAMDQLDAIRTLEQHTPSPGWTPLHSMRMRAGGLKKAISQARITLPGFLDYAYHKYLAEQHHAEDVA